MSKALDPHLNAAIIFIAHKLFPSGITASEDAPASFKELCAMLDSGKPITVYSGGSEKTIYGDPQVNHAFRAWHDWCHWQGRQDFNADGELMTCERQIRQLYDTFGWNGRTRRWADILTADIIGQATYLERHGRFPDNQKVFVELYLVNTRLAFSDPSL